MRSEQGNRKTSSKKNKEVATDVKYLEVESPIEQHWAFYCSSLQQPGRSLHLDTLHEERDWVWLKPIKEPDKFM